MRRFLQLLPFLWISFSAIAQESNCGNGIDDDGDGFIDCFDGDCATNPSCKDFYVGRDKLCQVPPSGVAQFSMKVGTTSANRTTYTSGRLDVGDLDADGIPEVITLHPDDKKLYILDGRDLSVKATGSITATAEYFDHAIGNINGDNCSEIFIAEVDNGIYYISCYDCKGNLIWRKAIYGEPITMGLADFGGDGKVELYYRNEILDAATGTRLVKGSGVWNAIDAGPVAVDMLDVSATCTKCAGLELVLGGAIYSVDLGARTADAGVLALMKSIPAAAKYYPKNSTFGYVTSLTSVADYTLDGSLDVVMSGATNATNGTTSVFLWDVKNNTYKIFQPPNNWQHGTGRINIADIDGDGKPNATFVSGAKLYALKDDFTLFWSVNITESTSGYTSTTVFDFNNDNAVEIVYRDEASLYIINGKNGIAFTKVNCRSRTANEYPVVADVDGDGSTEICVPCATNDADDINNVNTRPNGQIRTYKSNLEAWVPARKVWNQHGYFNVNVNDNLTIPKVQQKHHLIFSTGSCTTGPNRALNTFLNQSPFLDSKGCPTYASADITYDANSVQIVPPTCPDQDFTVSLDIKNIGDLGLSGTLPITFYQGNPMLAGAIKLNTVNINLSNFNVGNVVSLTNLSVQGTGNNFTLYVVLNDNGSTVPTPIKLPNSTFNECNYTNNIVSAAVKPAPFKIQTSLISNNIKCGTSSVPDNGAAEAYRLVGTTKVTAGYNFYWFNGATVGDTATAAFKGSVRTGLAAGTYSVVAYHKGIICGSTSAQVVVGNQSKSIGAVIKELSPFTNCQNPDGSMQVTLNGGDPAGNYTYQWFEGNVFGTSPTLSTSDKLTNIKSLTYSVLVTEKLSGCTVLESFKVTDKTIQPVVSATATDAICNPANSGGASASVGGNTSSYTFSWYIGGSVKPTADFTGATYASLTAGNYTVVAKNKTTGCTSDPYTVVVGSPPATPPVAASVLAQQTSCTISNGSAKAVVSGGTVGYTFKWYKGNNTLPTNLVGSVSTITNLAAGVYTVEATSITNGCVDTDIITINDVIVIPTIASAIVNTNLTQCSPLNGSATASAGAGSFTYYWFNGNVGTPDTLTSNYKGATYSGLNAGYYTVVAVNKATRCASARRVVQVIDNTTNPVLTTSSVNQTSCNSSTPNGQASANVGGITTGYKFRWFAGADTTVFLSQGATITNRAAGTYTVKGIIATTKCYSIKQVTIGNTLINPTVTSTIVNNTNCSGPTPTGSVTLQVNGGADPIIDFTIQWFEGNGTTVPLGTTVGNTSGTNKEKALGLSAGVYTARITDNTTPGDGCFITSTFNITNIPSTITVTSTDISITSQSNCSPANGSATVNQVTVNGTGIGNVTGYTFTWYQSNGITVIPSSGTAATVSTALAAGSYYVKATNTASNCSSSLTTFTVTDTHVTPVVTAASTFNNTNCTGATPNGSVTINIGGVAPVTGQYSIAWFEGSGTTTALGTTTGSVSGANNETAQALAGGTYTVVVTDLATPNAGCVTTKSFIIASNPPTLAVNSADINTTSQSNCTPANGSATVSQITVNGTGTGNTTGYTFTWYQTNGTTVVSSSGTAATIGTPLAAGSYYVKATSTASNCTSTLTAFTITDTHVNPIVTAASTVNNANCGGSAPNGSVTINIGGVAPIAGQYSIAWFEGSGTTTALGTTVGAVSGTNNETAQALTAGTYTVAVTDLVTPNTGCVATKSFTITNTPATVTVSSSDIAITSQSNCTPVNGSATVNQVTVNGTGTGNTTGYTFSWYQSNGTTVIPSSGTAATIGTTLAAGNYYVKATNTASNCSSSLTSFAVTDTHVNPVVTAATTINNSNCAGSTPNGLVTIDVGGIAPAVGQYSLAWYEGSGTTTALGTTVGSVSGPNNITALGLSAGTYTVVVTDLATPNAGCVSTKSFTITSTPATLTINNTDINVTSQSNCTPVNGSATVNQITVNGTGTGNATGYTFTWYQSNGTTVIASSGTAATIGTPLAAGSYYVKATSTTSNCSSSLTAFTITDTHVSPVVTAASTVDNSNCSGSTPTGTISINVGGIAPAAGQYALAWYEGSGTTTSLGTNVGSVTGANNETAQALSAGTYTVVVTDLVAPNTGCVATKSFTITNAPLVLAIASVDITVTSQSNCTPVNGSASVNQITVNGAGIGNTTGYTFTWYQSDGTTLIPSSGTSSTIGTPLAAGNYYVKATRTASNCSSLLASFTVTDTHINPDVNAASSVNNANCSGSSPNGSVTVDVGGIAPAVGQYSLAWFEGNGTTTVLGTTVGSISGTNNITAQGLPAGTYTVVVRDLIAPNAGCLTTKSFTITNTPVTLTVNTVDINVTSQSNCTPVNGSATVSQITVNGAGIGNTTGYTFTWYQSNGTTVIPSSGNAATIATPLAAGNYFVKATSSASNCSSSLASFTITDTHVNPLVTAASTINNANCSGSTPSGSITIDVGGIAPAVGQYSLAWYEGNGTTTVLGTTVGSVTGINNITAQGLSTGTYTVVVTDLAAPNAGCVATKSFTITNAPVTIAIASADISITSQSNCAPVNGSATVNQIAVNGTGIGNTTGYTFTWYQSDGTTAIPSSGNAATIGASLAAGSYYVKATSTASKCSSSLASFTVTDTHVNPTIAAASTINNTNCGGASHNGSITINVGGIAPAVGQYSLAWYEGSGATTALGTTVGSVTGTNNITAQGLSAGTYTVVVTDLAAPNAGCVATKSFTITSTPPTLTISGIDINVTSQSNCTPVNGSATVNQITVNGAGIGNTTGYTFTWYQNNGTTVIPSFGTAATIAAPLAAGSYFVKATSTASNCSSSLASLTITDTHVNPAITAASTINNINCTGSTPNGSITINVGGIAPAVGQYSVAWFEGSGTTTVLGTTVGSVSGTNNITAQSLSAGTYTVVVTDLAAPNAGCISTKSFTITSNPPVVTVDNADITIAPQSNCSPANGSATVTEITINGAGIGNTTGYTFTWYQSNGTTIVPSSGTASTIATPLAAGSYFVKTTNTTSNCSSSLTPFTVTDIHVNPTVASISSSDNTNCSGVTPTGSVTIQINGGADPVTDFIIDWFEGNGTTIALGTTVGTTSGINKEVAQALSAGTYTVRIRDNATPNSGCFVTSTFTVSDNIIYPIANGTPAANTACDPSKSNGSIVADVGGTTVGYTFHIFRGQNTLPANEVTTGPATASNLKAGVYTVQAISNTTGCAATTQVTVNDNIVLPAITSTANTDVTSCSTPDGTASVTAVSIGAVSDYTFSWYKGKYLKATADYTGSTITGLLAGDYTVTATNNVLGCDVQIPVTVTVVSDPSTLIAINELIGERMQPAVCNNGQGQLGVQASSPANALGFSFTWYQGDKNIGMTFAGNGQDFPVNSNRISNAASSELINSGLHTVIALDKTTGCFDSLSINLAYSDEAALLSVLTFPQTDCLAPDGAFEASITPSAGTAGNPANVGLDQGWYKIEIYQSGLLIKTVAGVNGTPITAPIIVTGLATGNYTVLAIETQVPPLAGCSSAPRDVNIADGRLYPVIAANTLIDNKNCTGSGSDNGSITLTVDGTPTPASGYSYNWHDGKLLSGPALLAANVPAPGHSAINIDGGFYTVQVTAASNNCKAEKTLYLNNTPYVISVPSADLNLVAQTNCSPANGLAEVTDVFLDGVSSAGTAGYTFAWFLNDGTTVIPASTNAALLATSIAAGSYFVQATGTASNCESPLIQFAINDNSVKPAITGNTLTDNANCSGVAANGSITIEVNGSVPATTDVSIQWYTGTGTATPIAGATSATLSALAAGDYTVEVIDILSPGNTCSSIATFTISDDFPVYSINSAAVTVTDQSDCVANGSATITDVLIDGISNGGVAGFTFSWLDNAGIAIAGAGNASTIAVPLAAGDYTVMATKTLSNCASIVTVFTVKDISVKPVIAVNTLTDNSNCSGAGSNGLITIDVDGGAPAITDFSIQWYAGTGTTTPIPGAINATLSGLAAGDYTVEVTDILSPGNTCSSIATFTISDDLPVYSINAGAVSVTDQSDCVGNGSATVTDVLVDGASNGGVAGFTFTWLDNAGVAIAGAGNAATIAVPLGAGDYSVRAISTTSNCSSIITVFTVKDISVTPVIALNTSVDNSTCSGAVSNGSITIDVDGSAPAITDFSIQWYAGIGTTAPITGAISATLSGLTAGDYTVEVTDILSPGNTCSSVATFTISDDLPVYTINSAAVTVTDQTDCVANGSATITDILIDGVSNGGVAGFTFSWLDNTGAAIAGAGSAATIAVPLGAGDFRVMATNTASNCSSIISTFTVLDVSAKPLITVNTLADNSNCSGTTPNGSITIDVDGATPAATDFFIQWYTGNGTTAPIPGAITPTVSGLAAGDYTVEVLDILSPGNTCSTIATITIVDDFPVYSIGSAYILINDQNDCVGNGSATVGDVLIDGVPNSGVAGFTFTWFDNAGIAIVGAGNTATIAVPLAAGNYSVMTTNTASTCSSIIKVFTVNDLSVTPVIAVNNLTNNSNCGGPASSGSITIDVDGSAPSITDFTIQWYTGIGTTAPIAGATTATLSALAAGDYTVEVTDILSPGNTCSSVATFTVVDALPTYLIIPPALNITHQSDCSANGSAAVTDVFIDNVSNGGVAGFTFAWLDNSGIAIPGAGNGATIAVPLAAGDYRVMATNTTTACNSIITIFTVQDISVSPVIAVNTLTDNSNCGGVAANGSITIDVDGGAPPATDFSIQWYTGTGTTAPIAGATTATLSGLAAGDYTVEVIDILSPGNTCSSVATFTIIDDLPVYSINTTAVTVTDQSDCVANGSATITDVLIDGASNGGVAGFTFDWLDNAGAAIAGAGNAPTIAVPLAAGDYRVMATNTASNCASIITAFTVKDVSVQPLIAANTLIDNSNCSGAAANGSITITANGAAPIATDFSIQWYTGTGTTTPIPGATTATISGLAAGDYTSEVIDILSPGNTCSSVVTFTITDDLPLYSINPTAVTVTDQSDCVANGSATITDVLIDGISNGGVTGFTFNWLDNAGAAIAGAGSAAIIAVPLAAGDYRVMATSTASNCSSVITVFTVKDISIKPIIAVNTLIDNSNCSGAASNGSITIDVDGAAPIASDFSIQWYTGTGTTAPILGSTTATLSGLATGDYTVEVIDILSPGNTCASVATFTITDDLPVYAINAAAVTITDQSDCVANGSATITDLLIDGVSNGGVAGFTFNWLDDASAVIPGAGNAATIAVPLAAGNYSVMAINTASNCSSIITVFTVKDISIKPVISVNTLIGNSNCSGAAANGSITLNVDGAAPAATDYSIQWYTGTGTTAPISGATTATLSGLAAGDYTVEVIDILSPGNTCSNVATFTITDDLPIYSINKAAITITDQSDCVANGSAIITDVLIDGVSNGGVAGFTFNWLDDSNVAIAGAGNAATISVPLAAGDYRVMATNIASNCSSVITVFTVKDISVNPVIAVSTLINNSNCNVAAANGSVTINVNGGAPAPTAFSIQWFTGIGTTTPIVGATAATVSALIAGDYTVQVTDILSPGNTCSTVSTFTINNTPNVVALDNSLMTLTNNSNCSPLNGSATITKVLFNGTQDGNTSNYTFEWLRADLTIADASTTAIVGAPLDAGNYFVRATHLASTCASAPTPFTIKSTTQIPVVVALKNKDNIACNASYTGQVSASVSEGFTNGVTAGYLFEWFKGTNNTNGADFIAAGTSLSNLQEGAYTVRVTDTSAPSKNCANITTINVGRQIPVLNGTLIASPQTACAPIQDGKIVANTVQVFVLSTSTSYDMNVTADRNKFTFQWYNESLTPITGPITGNNNSPFLEGGIYYNRLTDGLGCTSDYIKETIDDTTVKPAVSVQEFVNPAVCVLPELKGSILVTADGNPNFSDYTFEWHEGNNTAGPLVEPNSPFLTNISYTGPGQYTVKVSNNATQCVTLETYRFTTDTLAIKVIASAVPLTSCVADNGSLFAATRTGSGQLYNIEWYIGSNVGNVPDFTGNEVLIAPVGTYTAIAKHPTLAFCESIPDVVSITDERLYPTVMATQKDPVTYCDPSNPNGVAFASVNGNITYYTFDWYEDALTGKLAYTGSEAGVLKAITYIVKGTDIISGCYGTASVAMTSDILAVPSPDIMLVSDLADCVAPDGALSAAVKGITKDHIFSWYAGTTIKTQPDAIGEIFTGLVDGTYSVTATDRETGCTSPPVQGVIANIQRYPEFEIKTVSTSCDGAIGTAQIFASNDDEVQFVKWDIAGDIENGPQVINLPSGTFSVTVVTVKDCEATKSFLVNSDIVIYNGVSRNNDGKNDIFELGCIAEYPNNSVRIFNRSGSLVYEAKGYDNQDIYFNGISNRGVNILGNDLPDGTYFYIISKGDGSEDRTGYLELLH